jgi:hypothetical protein
LPGTGPTEGPLEIVQRDGVKSFAVEKRARVA